VRGPPSILVASRADTPTAWTPHGPRLGSRGHPSAQHPARSGRERREASPPRALGPSRTGRCARAWKNRRAKSCTQRQGPGSGPGESWALARCVTPLVLSRDRLPPQREQLEVQDRVRLTLRSPARGGRDVRAAPPGVFPLRPPHDARHPDASARHRPHCARCCAFTSFTTGTGITGPTSPAPESKVARYTSQSPAPPARCEEKLR
jgi:hypothetical protein